jgi:tRNA dimethylallyltransferase
MGRGPAILLMGPTGSGKTDVAAALAGELPLEIVSVDSAMVYRGMDIGTAKPPRELLKRAPHRLIDMIDPAESYSVARFLADAAAAMQDIAARGRVPLLAGGTMLYFRALQSGLARLPAADPALRGRLERRAAADLARVDPAAAARIRPNDRQRIQRALEVIEQSGRPLSAQLGEDLRGATHDSDLRLVLAPVDREALFERIALRFDDMLRLGLVEEVRRLRARGDLHAGLPSMRLIGYRQIWRHLDGESTLAEARQGAVAATRQLARRQLTWLRAEPCAEWFDALDGAAPERIAARVAEWLRNR